MKNSLLGLFALPGLFLLNACGGNVRSELTTTPPPTPQAAATHLSAVVPATATVGVAFIFTVTALDASNNVALSYSGVLHFVSSDGMAVLPTDSSLTNGVGNFSAKFMTAGSQTISVSDTVKTSIAGISNSATVSIATLAITSGAPPNGTVNSTYGTTFQIAIDRCSATFTGWEPAAVGGTGKYQWSWSAAPGSSLPPGLGIGSESYTCGGSTRCCETVNSPGLIHGTPSAAGTYHVIVTVTDTSSPPDQANANYTIIVGNPTSAAALTSAKEVSDPPLHAHYKLVDVGTLGGPNSNPAVASYNGGIAQSLSRGGVFAGQAETSTPDPFNPNCFDNECLATHATRWENGLLIDLGTLSGPAGLNSLASWISPNGIIVGISENGVIDPFGNPVVHTVVWKNDEIIDLKVLQNGYESVSSAVNSSGDIVGYGDNGILDTNSLASSGWQTRAILWHHGKIHDLGTLGGADAIAISINERGQIIGWSYTADSFPNTIATCSDQPLTVHSFIWDNYKMVDLNTLGGSCTLAYALNNQGQVVGQSTLIGESGSHAFVWEKGAIKDLGALGGTYSYAGWINDSGEIVGAATPQGDLALLAVLWKDGKITNLGALEGDFCSAPDAINSKGQLVGGSGFNATPNFPACTNTVEHAVIWDNGQILDLNNLVAPGAKLVLAEATYINDGGEISGYGYLANGDMHAFVLIPCDASHADIEGCDYNLVDDAVAVPRQLAPVFPSQTVKAQPGFRTNNHKPSMRRFAHPYFRQATSEPIN